MSITTEERFNLVRLTVAMFDAAPGATYLAQLAAVYESNGHSYRALAGWIANTILYKSFNPDSQSADAFATALLTPLGLQGNQAALGFIRTRMDAGMGKGDIVYDGLVALYGTSAPQYDEAKAILNNETVAAQYFSVTLANPEQDPVLLHEVIAMVTANPSSIEEAIFFMTPGDGPHPIDLTDGNDVYTIREGNYSINGLGGNDSITTGNGTNTITTLSGNDSLTTGSGDDTVIAGDGNNTVQAGSGNNSVTTGSGSDAITTGSGNDAIASGAGNDTISAGAGSDAVTGGPGDDSIALGADAAADRVVFAATAATNGVDTITGFTSGVDHLDVDQMTPDAGATTVAGNLTVEAGNVYFLATAQTGAADSSAASAAAIQAAADWTNGTTGGVAFFVVSDNNSSAVYQYTEAGGAGITSAELVLMGTVDDNIADSDLLFG